MKKLAHIPTFSSASRYALFLVLAGIFLLPLSSKASVVWDTVQFYQLHDTIFIEWSTLSESNNKEFYIDFVPSTTTFPFGPVTAAGNTSGKTDYAYTIPLSPAGISFSGNYCVYIIAEDSAGNTSTSDTACTYLVDATTLVWPGDANSDGVANAVDLLNIGIANGATGPARSGASTNWVGQTGTQWNPSFTNGLNYKFTDCDGNGTINLNDTLALVQNYGLTHNKSHQTSATGVPLTLVFPDSVNSLDTAEIEIWLGDAANPIPAAYGLAFSLSYDTAQVQTGLSKGYIASSWLGTPGSDLVKLCHDDNLGQIDFAATRTDGMNSNGYGKIGGIAIVMVDNLSKTWYDAELRVSGFNPILIDKDGKRVDVALTVSVGRPPQPIPAEMKVYPNPAQKQLRIDPGTRGFSPNTQIRLFSLAGKEVKSAPASGNALFTFEVSELPAGLYLLQIESESNTQWSKVLVK